MPKLIEKAVRWRVFDKALTNVRDKFASMPTQELKETINEAIAAARKTKPAKSR